jgi:acyl CoA:acetate/3-ketoacid CoA transferase
MELQEQRMEAVVAVDQVELLVVEIPQVLVDNMVVVEEEKQTVLLELSPLVEQVLMVL